MVLHHWGAVNLARQTARDSTVPERSISRGGTGVMHIMQRSYVQGSCRLRSGAVAGCRPALLPQMPAALPGFAFSQGHVKGFIDAIST